MSIKKKDVNFLTYRLKYFFGFSLIKVIAWSRSILSFSKSCLVIGPWTYNFSSSTLTSGTTPSTSPKRPTPSTLDLGLLPFNRLKPEDLVIVITLNIL